MSPEELKEFQKQQCIFCQIIDGKVPSKKIFEDKICMAVMDVNPAAPGHVLLLPKEHYAIMPQVPDDEIGHLFMAAKHISQAMLRKLGVEGTNIFVANGGVAGQRAQHFMIHIIPRKEGDEVLDLPEHIVEIQMREKLAEIIGKRADKLFGIKRETQERLPVTEKEEPEESLPEPSVIKEEAPAVEIEEPEVEEKFITSETAKRYHKSKCAFAQNIKKEKRIHLSKEELEKSEKKPCTCITGKNIHLYIKTSPKNKTSAKKTKQKTSTKNKKPNPKKKKGDKASLDDIANLFK